MMLLNSYHAKASKNAAPLLALVVRKHLGTGEMHV